MTGAGRPADWPGVEPIKSARIYEEIVRQVKQLIAAGRLKSGDRLPPERDLAEKFVVQRVGGVPEPVEWALRLVLAGGIMLIGWIAARRRAVTPDEGATG